MASNVELPRPRGQVITACVRTCELHRRRRRGIAMPVPERIGADPEALVHFCAERLGLPLTAVRQATLIRNGEEDLDLYDEGSWRSFVAPLQQSDLLELSTDYLHSQNACPWPRGSCVLPSPMPSGEDKGSGDLKISSDLAPPDAGKHGREHVSRAETSSDFSSLAQLCERQPGSPRSLRARAQTLIAEARNLGLTVPPLAFEGGSEDRQKINFEKKPQKFFRDSCRGNTRDIKRRRRREAVDLLSREIAHLENVLGPEIVSRVTSETAGRKPRRRKSHRRKGLPANAGHEDIDVSSGGESSDTLLWPL